MSKPVSHIHIQGAHEHNLKHIDLRIPHRRLTVITGVSGSGKTSLAYDTLYAEGQRRFVENLSTYARQFLGKIEKPKVEQIRGIAPTVAIRQKNIRTNARSTVGTVTEIYDYLRLLFARVGRTISPVSGREVKKHTVADVLDFLWSRPEGSKWLLTVELEGGTEEKRRLAELYAGQGFVRMWTGGRILDLNPENVPEHPDEKTYLVIDRIQVSSDEDYRRRIAESVEQAFSYGHGHLQLIAWPEGTVHTFSNKFELDGMEFPEPDVHLFGFNNPYGACPVCEGFGSIVDIDPDKVIPDKSRSIYGDAIAPWVGKELSKYKRQLILAADRYGISVHKPWRDLPEEHKKLIWEGAPGFTGIRPFFRLLEEKSYKIQNRVMLARYRGKTLCHACGGKRLRPEAGNVYVGGKNIGELVDMPLDELARFFAGLSLDDYERQVAGRILEEITKRLDFIIRTGLPYLTLNRTVASLSGGEMQRIRLATSLGSGLTGAIYILDEPSIGLHPRDTGRLIGVLKDLRDKGSTVVVVEHEEEMMKAADHIIDMGPGAGVFGGEVVAEGSYEQILRSHTLTGDYLSGRRRIPVPKVRRPAKDFIRLRGVRHHNLQNIDVAFPLHTLTVVTGVSGSGKSSLVNEVLYPALMQKLQGYGPRPGEFDALEGAWKQIKQVELIDQNAIGRSSRSNPVTYIKVYDEIRQLMAAQRRAKLLRLEPRHFSFNTPGGRCEVCKGEGVIRIDMQFMADVEITCEACGGKKFKDHVLEVKFHGKNIHDILEMSVDEAVEFFEAYGEKKIADKLRVLQEVGLNYVQLGQPVSTFSGGEAQRLKLATYLLKGRSAEPVLFLFDEPTTGLHFHDIRKLLAAFDRLIEHGHSIVVIEHNTELIKSADHIIDLGPEGGKGGGQVVFTGTPEELVRDGRSLLVPYLDLGESS
ncbi:MAG: excinuclease ABC subunit UvrA [Chlorobi bacterium]|nr:excinuclease ABC subunit UvrA [Chlorobiota bacterium]